jgi:hypothetical protein
MFQTSATSALLRRPRERVSSYQDCKSTLIARRKVRKRLDREDAGPPALSMTDSR